jgi:hypothetical protein
LNPHTVAWCSLGQRKSIAFVNAVQDAWTVDTARVAACAPFL